MTHWVRPRSIRRHRRWPAAVSRWRRPAAVAELAARDPDLAGIVARYGPPPLWDREPGFATLLHIILEQQVSLASAARRSIGCAPRPTR